MDGVSSMRKLIQIRIVHSPADMGSMKDGLIEASIAKIGQEKWEENRKKIENFWKEAEAEIDTLGLEYEKTRIYQDGLPCGGELGVRIVNDTAEKGSRNYRIIKKLIAKGATIEATENPQLLLKEYEFIKRLISAPSEKERAEAVHQYERAKSSLIEERDRFIAKTIDATLKDGETGILFIGADHDVVSKLPEGVEVKKLD